MKCPQVSLELDLELQTKISRHMEVILLALISSLVFISSPALARSGPGAGGGTVVRPGNGPDSSGDVLLDFESKQNEKGIDPVTYDGIYERLLPKLNRW